LPRKLGMKVDKINKKDGYTELEVSILWVTDLYYNMGIMR
jgi:hypothetical protein